MRAKTIGDGAVTMTAPNVFLTSENGYNKRSLATMAKCAIDVFT